MRKLSPALLALLIGSFTPLAAQAMSYEDAAFNLTLIEGARREAEFCAPSHPKASDLWLAWIREVAPLREDSIKRLRQQARSAGLSAADEEQFIDRALARIRERVATVPNKATHCPYFAGTLNQHKASLRR